ncbi:hypothetical protein CA600_21145 [Paenibacillus sp. VTT E-133280]|jgi:hypothetical protein|uniref:hypothetical protein n=1 Tax=Paenibacillus sp. VTT E-133280 TaxID=1986222 RepID=UPI000B9FF02A|nr:hypothetical protein [Paenibacillus sp. VTT E-133280]OZQ62772.1 hypothetical protein CA600_21145 [Paenibacillus sp. VTT E-133280]
MTYNQPSQENVDKVTTYFVSRVKADGSRRFSEKLSIIAKSSDVALATAHRVIKLLESEKKITIIRQETRRIPTEYIYTGDIDGFLLEKDKDEQITYLQNLVRQLEQENINLRKQTKRTT